jgi:hypothetical protein
MKLLKTIFFFLLIQNLNAQTEVELVFWDSCENKILKTEYEVNNLNNDNEFYSSKNSKVTLPKGQYFISFGKLDGDLIKSSSQILEVKDSEKIHDTLVLPKILFTIGSELHSQNWNYYNCEKICDGHQIDFYSNGNLRLDGIFENGKPSQITEFREDGSKEVKYWFKTGYLFYIKIEYFDENGNLEEYEIHKNRKNKIVKMIYDANGKFLRKE